MNRAVFMPALLAIAACAQPFEGRVASRLQAAGIPKNMAECMANRWVEKLNVLQLRKIQRLTDDIIGQYKGRTLTPLDFVERMRRVDDPEIFRVVSASVPVCALLS
jgi:hypothetical protein